MAAPREDVLSSLSAATRGRIRLFGDPGAVAWVERTLAAAGIPVARVGEAERSDPEFFGRWPLLWVVRPGGFGAGGGVPRTGPEAPPCLVVLPPGAEATSTLVGEVPVESFEFVREPDDAALLASRLERLFLLHRRRSPSEEQTFREKLRAEAKRNEILAAIALASRDSIDLDEVLGTASSLLGTRLSATSVEIWFLDESLSMCQVFMHWRVEESIPSLVGEERPLPESPAFQSIIASHRPYAVSDRGRLDPASVEAVALEQLGAQSFLGVPIQREGETMGVLGLSWAERRDFAPDELVFFERVADQLALAIRTARLYGNLQTQLEALAYEQQRREAADLDRSRLTAMLVHDMKNPLSALTAALELTREKERRSGDERLARMLDGSLASARGLQGLIEDALLVYRSEDAPETERRPVPPAEALGLPLEEARWLGKARRVWLATDFADDLPSVPLEPQMFRRAAANLLSNAVKYSPAGSTVKATARMRTEDGRRYFVFSVADEGPGLAAGDRSRLATPYARFSGSETVPGTGLGLTVVQKVLQAHGGYLDVARNEPRGSVFSLWFPA